MVVVRGCEVMVIVDISVCWYKCMLGYDMSEDPQQILDLEMVTIKVPSPVDMVMYWLDINYLMLWSSRRADLTYESIGDPKACKVKKDPVDQ